MNEKRFIFYEYDDGTETIEDTEENEYYHFSNELVCLLNDLDSENKYLKIVCRDYILKIERLEKYK